MAQLLDHTTYQIYETYHTPVSILRDARTYDHFASGHSRTLRQPELLAAYMEQMINAIMQDVNHQGDCWLLRAIVSHEIPAIHLLDHSAILYVYATLFAPEELPRLDARSIPFSSGFSSTPGGMLYADRRARSTVLDQRSNELLHPICHTLLMYARHKAAENAMLRLQEDKNALNSRITQLNDRILGLERELAALRRDAACGTPDESSEGV